MQHKMPEAKTVRQAKKPAKKSANGYLHVTEPATVSEIWREWGITQTHLKRYLKALRLADVKS